MWVRGPHQTQLQSPRFREDHSQWHLPFPRLTKGQAPTSLSSLFLVTKMWLPLLWLHRLKPTRFHCPWDFPGKNTGVDNIPGRNGLPFPLPGDLPDPGVKPVSPDWQVDSFLLNHQAEHFEDIISLGLHSHSLIYTCYCPLSDKKLRTW